MASHLIHTGPKVIAKKLPLKLGHNVNAHLALKTAREAFYCEEGTMSKKIKKNNLRALEDFS